MKNTALAFFAVAILGTTAAASPYFRPIDPNHPYKVIGGYIDMDAPGNTSAGTAVALVTHGVKDGCLLPSVVCEDWSPAMAGFSYNAGRLQFNVGPAVNLTPMAKIGALRLLNLLTKDDTLAGIKSLLGSQPISGPDVSTSFGPALNVTPIEHGVILPLNKWKGRPRMFVGAALRF